MAVADPEAWVRNVERLIGSVLSHRANRKFAHYTAAKHGVLGLVRAFGLELAEPHSVRGRRSETGRQ